MYQLYEEKERKLWLKNYMHEREIIINGQGDTERVPYPLANNPIITSDIKRAEVVTYEEGMEWNKQAQEHNRKFEVNTQPYAEVEIKPIGNKVWLSFMADIHWPNFGVDYDRLDADFKRIEETPDAYVAFAWNLLDAPIVSQFPDGVLRNGQHAQEALYTFKDKLMKLHKLNKIVGAIGSGSCHEGWTKKKAGWDIYRELFDGINIPLLNNGGILNIKLPDYNYKVGLFHKLPYHSTLNKTHGGQRVMDRIADCDIAVTSHYHFAEISQGLRFNPPFRKDVGVVATGTYMLDDGWAKDNFGKEGEPGGQSVILFADRKKFQTIFYGDVAQDFMK